MLHITPLKLWFFYPQGHYWRSPYKTQNNLNYLEFKIVIVNTHIDKNIFVTTVCAVSKHNISQLIYQHFGRFYTAKLKWMARKVLTKGFPTNLPDLEEPCHICLLTKATKNPRGPNIDVSIPSLGSYFTWILRILMLNVSMYLSLLLWIYVLLLHTPLDFHP